MSIRDHHWHERCACQYSARRRPFTAPDTQRRYTRDRVVDVQHIRLEIAVDYENRAIRGVCTTRCVPFQNDLQTLALDAKELQIESVSLEGEGPQSFSLSEDKLNIVFSTPRREGETFNLVIRYRAQPRRGMYFISPDEAYPNKHKQVWTQGQDEDSRHWFPCFDYPNEKATSEVIASVPRGWFALSNGSLVSRRDDGNQSIFHWRQEIPHVTYLITLAAGEFVALEEKHGELPVVAYVSPGDEEKGRRSFSHTKDMIAFFEKKIGHRYPYAKYAQIVVDDFIFGGMENTSATTLMETSIYDETAALDQSADPLVAHELAHQWFGDLLTCRDWSHAWLNEGFASYWEALWEEERRGLDEMRYYLKEVRDSYFAEDSSYRRPIVCQTYNDPIEIFDRHLYEKGALVLHMLRHLLGEESFWRSIRRYVTKNAQGSVITQHLVQAIEEETGKNMEWFFDQWVFGVGYPEYEASFSWDATSKLASVQIKQTQPENNESKLFSMPLSLTFCFDTERNQSHTVQISKKEHSFYFSLSEEPKDFRVDMGGALLKKLKYKKSKAMLKFQLSYDSDVCGRIAAATELMALADPESVLAVGVALASEPFWGVRVEIAGLLGKHKGANAKQALLNALGDASSKVRRAVTAALGNFKNDEAVERALLQRLQEDVSYFVQGEAAKGLGRMRSPQALAAIETALSRDAWADAIRSRALDGLALLRDKRGIAIATKFAQYGHKPQARAAAVGALAKLAQEFPETKSEILDTLIDLCEKPGFRVHLSLAGALGSLKDARASEALETLAARELDGRIRRRVRDALDEISQGAAADDGLKNLRAELEKLREANRSLTDRLEKLEVKSTTPSS